MSKITLKTRAQAGKVEVPPGEYMVAAAPESSAIALSGHGKTYLLTAVNRRSPASLKAKKTTVQFYSMGGSQWTLAVILPQRGEWACFLTVDKKKD